MQKGVKESRVNEEILDLENRHLSLKGPWICLFEIVQTMTRSGRRPQVTELT